MLWIQIRKLPSLQTTSESRPLEGMHNRCVSDDRPTLHGTALGEQNGLPLSIGAVIKLARTRRIEFLGLTKTGLSDIDDERLASARAASPRRDTKNSPSKERLDLTQIDFGLEVRDRLY